MRLGTRAALTVGLCLLLASCGGDAKPVGPSAAPSAPAASAFPSPAMPATPISAAATTTPVGPIVWTTAVDPRTSAPADTVTAYAPNAPRIIAAAPVRGLPDGATLTASWSYNDTSLDAFATSLSMTADTEQTWISFYIERSEEALWPEGVYEISILLDGQEVARSTVEVLAQA